MSVADKLGTGSSFSHARGRSARGRAKAVAQGDVPLYELVRLHLEEVSPTPLNPRRNFGTDEQLARFGEELRGAQLAACVAVTRDAYLALWPDHAEQIGEARHVLVNGERRYRSAVHVGLDALDFVVRDDLASTREDFINHLLKENLDREDFDVIERARGIQQLVEVCAEDGERGARTRAAQRLGKDRSWVTNQLALLVLPDEVQNMLSSGAMAERDGRLLARHSKENPGMGSADLIEHLKAVRATEAESKAEARAILEAARGASAKPSSLLSADNEPLGRQSAGDARPAGAVSLSADNETPPVRPSHSPAGDPSPAPAPNGLLSADNVPSVSGRLAAGPVGERSPDETDSPVLLSADNNTGRAGTGGEASPGSSAGLAEPAALRKDASDGVPVPRGGHPGDGGPLPVVRGIRFPYDNAVQAAEFLNDRMDDAQFLILVDTLNEMAEQRRGLVRSAGE
ncbi:plasmid partitioning protein [Streptomyces sp. CAU 1734]|uniref:plasmid partitioning protein n=1 Tax=Streptomyces sp. CAU 1734 TaxID=3140360 RepID=UPI003261B1FB